MKRALITGITGQDGSYLAELLLSKGYEVHGLMRRSSTFSTDRIDPFFFPTRDGPYGLTHLHYGDLTDGGALVSLLRDLEPDEVYNLGAQSHVKVSFENPNYTVNANALGALRLLEALRDLPHPPRVYQASSSEMFGASEPPQSEATPFHPRSPYACSKVFAYYQTINYREAYGLHASNGILFNHESPRRGETFVTRKITRAATRIQAGLQTNLVLGNLDSRRDWGFAGDYVEAMWLMLQQDCPDDFVIATGESHSVQEFVELAFELCDLDWKEFVEVDERYFRPAEVHHLEGDASKAREVLGWEPKVGFKDLVKLMVDSDARLAREEVAIRGLE